MKVENNEFKKVCIKNRTCYYFDDLIKIQDFNSGNILLDEKSYENTLSDTKPLRIMFDKVGGFIRD